MNQNRFEKLMHAVDDELLEEARQPLPRRRARLGTWAFVTAACLCLVIGAVLFLNPGAGSDAQPEAAALSAPPAEPAAEPDAAPVEMPVETPSLEEAAPGGVDAVVPVTAEDLAALGYDMVLPEEAQSPSYGLIELGGGQDIPMAQATFTLNGEGYTYRALRTDTPQDISGAEAAWDTSTTWNTAAVDLQVRQTAEDAVQASVVSWYVSESGTQWCLVSEADSEKTVTTAYEILHTVGYDMAVAPAGAENIAYTVFPMEDMTVAETAFTLDGTTYAYRTASTGAIEFRDISGVETPCETEQDAEVGWCSAHLSYTEGAEGRIVWFDIAPGLVYSLHMDQGASEEALLTMAEALYTPAQGEVDGE